MMRHALGAVLTFFTVLAAGGFASKLPQRQDHLEKDNFDRENIASLRQSVDENDSKSSDDYGIEVVNTAVQLYNSTKNVVRTFLGDDAPAENSPLQYDQRVIKELREHFTAIDEPAIISLSVLLQRMKKTAYDRVYGLRNFGHDGETELGKVNSVKQSARDKLSIAPFLFEGDILLSESQASSILTHLRDDSRSSRSLSSDTSAIWNQMPILYRFHDSLEYFAISQIIEAIRFWEANTCLRFEHVHDRLAETEDYIEFFKGQGCYSMIGRKVGRQGISIGVNCERMGIIEHEIGHALGLWHEQSRPDASKYVDVRKEFIIPAYISDFQRRGTDEIITLGVPYDYGSIMHYGPTAFSADGFSDTLVTKDPLYQSTIGQREQLSFYDVQIINKVYCANKCKYDTHGNLDDATTFNLKYNNAPITCHNGGYSHPTNCSRCICPSGYGGNDCSSFQPPKNADCGGILHVNFDEWHPVRSPGYDTDGYEEDQRCSWVVIAPRDARILVEFVDEFAFLCSSICQDFVELKLARDQRLTGARFCCDVKPEEPFISETNQMAIIFRSQASQDRGFHLRLRAIYGILAKRTPDTTTEMPTTKMTTIAGINIWAKWGEWSACSRSCGGCGIRSRVRICRTAECENKSQEFSACNFNACPAHEDCARLQFLNRVCQSDPNGNVVSVTVCSDLSTQLNDCDQPSCCPPFYALDGLCVSKPSDVTRMLATSARRHHHSSRR